MARERRINVRAKGDLKDRLERACKITGANETSLITACVESLVDYVEEHGEITLPLVVIPKSAVKKSSSPVQPAVKRSRTASETALHGMNEPEGEYTSRKKTPSK